jgi:F-type H+-transporting ATPase subunit b
VRRTATALTLLIPFGQAVAAAGAGAHDHTLLWKWVNFAILAGILGYMISRRAGAFFGGRTQEIQQGIREASRLRQEAEARAADIDRRLAALPAEIEQLRRAAQEEIAAEGERLRRETEAALAKIREQGQQEIAAIASAARQELKAYSAELAVKLAEEKLRAWLTPELDAELVGAFLQDLERRGLRVPVVEVH